MKELRFTRVNTLFLKNVHLSRLHLEALVEFCAILYNKLREMYTEEKEGQILYDVSV